MGTGNVPQPGRGKIERRLPVWECTKARAPPDLAQNALGRIVGADAPPASPQKAIYLFQCTWRIIVSIFRLLLTRNVFELRLSPANSSVAVRLRAALRR